MQIIYLFYLFFETVFKFCQRDDSDIIQMYCDMVTPLRIGLWVELAINIRYLCNEFGELSELAKFRTVRTANFTINSSTGFCIWMLSPTHHLHCQGAHPHSWYVCAHCVKWWAYILLQFSLLQLGFFCRRVHICIIEWSVLLSSMLLLQSDTVYQILYNNMMEVGMRERMCKGSASVCSVAYVNEILSCIAWNLVTSTLIVTSATVWVDDFLAFGFRHICYNVCFLVANTQLAFTATGLAYIWLPLPDHDNNLAILSTFTIVLWVGTLSVWST